MSFHAVFVIDVELKCFHLVDVVIYVDGSESAPLRQHLYTMLEGSDPNQGRYRRLFKRF